MKTNLDLTAAQRSRMGNANINALREFLGELIENPAAIAQIPDEGIVILETEDDWVNQQNRTLKSKFGDKAVSGQQVVPH